MREARRKVLVLINAKVQFTEKKKTLVEELIIRRGLGYRIFMSIRAFMMSFASWSWRAEVRGAAADLCSLICEIHELAS